MIKIENVEIMGWEHVIRGMRNPMNSWEKSDSGICKAVSYTHLDVYKRQEGDLSPFLLSIHKDVNLYSNQIVVDLSLIHI